MLCEGAVLERAAVNFSRAVGRDLPAAATAGRPELVGATYDAVSVSLIVHPRNPYAPTSHANFRFFLAGGHDCALPTVRWRTRNWIDLRLERVRSPT